MTTDLTPLLDLIEHMESDLAKIKTLVAKLQPAKSTSKTAAESVASKATPTEPEEEDPNVKVIDGIFDGYFMIGSDTKKYPVPMNYSSKSKLIQGDQLKLRIMADGSLKYKVTKPADRKFVKAVLTKHEDGRFQAIDDNKKVYNLNQAAVTFFTGETGNEVSLIVPLDDKADYAAIEAVVK